MPAHRDAVLGVNALKSPNIYDADFFTWSSGGTVHFWNIQGRCQATKQVELEQLQASDDDIPNELKVLRATENMKSFIAGDRYGVLRYRKFHWRNYLHTANACYVQGPFCRAMAMR